MNHDSSMKDLLDVRGKVDVIVDVVGVVVDFLIGAQAEELVVDIHGVYQKGCSANGNCECVCMLVHLRLQRCQQQRC